VHLRCAGHEQYDFVLEFGSSAPPGALGSGPALTDSNARASFDNNSWKVTVSTPPIQALSVLKDCCTSAGHNVAGSRGNPSTAELFIGNDDHAAVRWPAIESVQAFSLAICCSATH
jgi:hypothetical protein